MVPNNDGDNNDDEDEKRRMKDKFGAGVVDGKRVTLCCIDLQIPKGSLVAIVGKVGSGKSTLLSSILNETEK